MEDEYNNLRYQDDWESLFKHLLVKSGWCKESDATSMERILSDTFGNECQSAVALLLQGLSPIRFAFMDGQSRMTSMYYFERKIIPLQDGCCKPLVAASGLSLKEISERWSTTETSNLAVCRVYLPRLEEFGTKVTKSFLSEMRKVSKDNTVIMDSHQASLQSMSPSNLNDCIVEMIDKNPFGKRAVTVKKLPDDLGNAFLYVIKTVRCYGMLVQQRFLGKDTISKLRHLDDEQFAKKALEMIRSAGERVIFPKFKTRSKSKAQEFQALMLVLGAALVDDFSSDCLETCINHDWIMPINCMEKEYKFASDDLHGGMFVDPSHPNKEWFSSKLYLVSYVSKK